MCLGIPGRVVEVLDGNAGMLARVDVLGAVRPVNLGMLEDMAVLNFQLISVTLEERVPVQPFGHDALVIERRLGLLVGHLEE